MLEATGQNLAEVKGPHAFLCHLCEGKLLSISKLEEQIRTTKADVISILRSSTAEEGVRQHQSVGQKRGHEDPSTPATVAKEPRVDSRSLSSYEAESQSMELSTSPVPQVQLLRSPDKYPPAVSQQQSPTEQVPEPPAAESQQPFPVTIPVQPAQPLERLTPSPPVSQQQSPTERVPESQQPFPVTIPVQPAQSLERLTPSPPVSQQQSLAGPSHPVVTQQVSPTVTVC